ncbi:MAG: GGDEF domain-containing protein [Pseudomonadota bacterium]
MALLLFSLSTVRALDEILGGRASNLIDALWLTTPGLPLSLHAISLGLVALYALIMILRLQRSEGVITERTVRLGKALGSLSLIRQSAELDALTGALARGQLEDRLRHECEISRRRSQPLAVVMMDIDHFKSINDNYGHAAGDAILQQFVSTAMGFKRSTDLLFRYGGEEFLLLMPMTKSTTATLVAERLRSALQHAQFAPVGVTASFGVAQLRNGESPKHMVERADAALYRAKGEGRNRVVRAD